MFGLGEDSFWQNYKFPDPLRDPVCRQHWLVRIVPVEIRAISACRDDAPARLRLAAAIRQRHKIFRAPALVGSSVACSLSHQLVR